MTAEQELQEYFKAGKEAKNLPLLLNRRIQDGKRDKCRYEQRERGSGGSQRLAAR